MSEIKRGNIYGTPSLYFQVLGGPNILTHWNGSASALFTVRWDHGATRVVEADFIRKHPLLSYIPLVKKSDVITNWCSNCEEDDMIFYSEDYICAWCREHLEDGVC